jgi:hypothetical protein
MSPAPSRSMSVGVLRLADEREANQADDGKRVIKFASPPHTISNITKTAGGYAVGSPRPRILSFYDLGSCLPNDRHALRITWLCHAGTLRLARLCRYGIHNRNMVPDWNSRHGRTPFPRTTRAPENLLK